LKCAAAEVVEAIVPVLVVVTQATELAGNEEVAGAAAARGIERQMENVLAGAKPTFDQST